MVRGLESNWSKIERKLFVYTNFKRRNKIVLGFDTRTQYAHQQHFVCYRFFFSFCFVDHINTQHIPYCVFHSYSNQISMIKCRVSRKISQMSMCPFVCSSNKSLMFFYVSWMWWAFVSKVRPLYLAFDYYYYYYFNSGIEKKTIYIWSSHNFS